MAWVHLSRWTRIGIVASVIWFVLFGGYLFVTWSGELHHSYQRQLHECYQTLSFTLQSEDLREQKGTSEYNNCIAGVRSGDFDLEDLLYLLLLDVGTIVFGWIAVMSIISVSRWNTRRIRSKPELLEQRRD